MVHQFEELRHATRENFHRIWEADQAGHPLSAEDTRLAEAMRAHPEYHKAWEFSDAAQAAPYAVDGVNPYLHIAAHIMIEAQLQADDPPEATQALHRLQRSGIDRHQAVHHVAAELLEVMFPVLRDGKAFDLQRYRKRLRRLGRSA